MFWWLPLGVSSLIAHRWDIHPCVLTPGYSPPLDISTLGTHPLEIPTPLLMPWVLTPWVLIFLDIPTPGTHPYTYSLLCTHPLGTHHLWVPTPGILILNIPTPGCFLLSTLPGHTHPRYSTPEYSNPPGHTHHQVLTPPGYSPSMSARHFPVIINTVHNKKCWYVALTNNKHL